MKRIVIMLTVLLGLFGFWTWKGLREANIHDDLARDLSQVSNIWIHKIVWLGPELRVGFPTSPIYFYFFAPLLFLLRGNGESLVLTETLLGLVGFGAYAWSNRRRPIHETLLVLLGIGLSPWWITAVIFPWNGYTYLLWLFIALTALWYRWRLSWCALLLGIAIAIHPAALLLVPLLLVEWWNRSHHLRTAFVSVVALIIPWGPIILFEIITKGFLTREWLKHRSSSFVMSANLGNIQTIVAYTHLPLLILLVVTLFVIIKGKRERTWLLSLLPAFFFVSMVTGLYQYYLLGLTLAVAFTSMQFLVRRGAGRVLLVGLIIFNVVTLVHTPSYPAGRSIAHLHSVVQHTITAYHLDPTKTYAVLNIRDAQNSTPQADDYRFFMRTSGYHAPNIDDYPTADYLLLFIEVPGFDWSHWNDWHTERFGKRTFVEANSFDNVEVVLYKRSN